MAIVDYPGGMEQRYAEVDRAVIGPTLDVLMNALDLTNQGLGHKAHVSPDSVSRWRNGGAVGPSIDLDKLAAAIGVSVGVLSLPPSVALARVATDHPGLFAHWNNQWRELADRSAAAAA